MEKQRFEFDRLKILISALLAVMVLLIGLLFFRHADDQYGEFRNVSSENKKAGETIRKEFKEEAVITAIHYPKFTDEKLNQLVEKVVEDARNYQGDESDLIFLDYASGLSFDQYVSIHFVQKVYDKNRALKQEKASFIVYDMKEQKEMTVHDLFRSDYTSAVLAQLNGLPVYFQIDSDGIRCYDQEGMEMGLFAYAGNERYIALKNPSVPSLAPAERPYADKMVIDPNKPMIVFTFDDGPTPEITERIMNAFLSVNGRATFFELGNRMEAYGDITKKLYEHGFEIGNHSYSHANLSIADEAALRQEIYSVQDIAYSITGEEIVLVRPTYGAVSDLMKEVIPLRMINWTVDSLDWKSRDKDAIIAEVLPDIEEGAIVLMHDLYTSTAEAVEEMLPVLAEKGYQFVTLSDYLKLKEAS